MLDPKYLIGKRAFDYANIFCYPKEIALNPERMSKRLGINSKEASLDRQRLLKWIAA